MSGWRHWHVPARTMTPDGMWYYVGAPCFMIVDHRSPNFDDNDSDSDSEPRGISYLKNNGWCYYAECDLVIFALFYGEVVTTSFSEDQEQKGEEEFGNETNDNDINISKKELDEVTNWPRVLEKMNETHWAFSQEKLEAYWKKTIIPRLRKIRETHARRFKNSNGGRDYNALAGLAATCHTRNVDPADHPHGYGKPMPTASELYKERICQKFGGKSFEVIREQEQALKQGRKLKKAKRDDGEGCQEDGGGGLVPSDG